MAKSEGVNICLVGQAFMGRAHSNAWTQVNRFFDPPRPAVQHTIVARDREALERFAPRWGWRQISTDYRQAMADPAIELVDITAPNHMHVEMASAAMAAGKAVACEKPLARNLDETRQMVHAAREAKVPTFVWYSYRRCPAVAYAWQLVRSGVLGEVRHVRAFYLQDWADESVPMIWRFDKQVAGSGSHGDLGAHIIDMTQFVTGETITEICGAMQETFVRQRASLTKASGGGIAGGAAGGGEMTRVEVDDATLFLARFSGGAVAQFEATRMATGNQNKTGFEINGSRGALRFNFERMNELEYFEASGPKGTRGWRTIMCTHAPDHPYVEAWWPDAHVIGYEHTFTHMAYDILRSLTGHEPVIPLPSFEDAYGVQRVLHAVDVSAAERTWVKLADVL